jgi:hypothetical protein
VSSIRNLLCAALTVAVLFSAPSAEARFGKRSDSSDSSEKKSSKKHNATAVGDDDDDAPRQSRRRSSSSGWSFLADVVLTLLVESRPAVAYVAQPPPPVQPPPPAQLPPPEESSPEVRSARAPEPAQSSVRMGVDGAAMNTVGGLSAFLGVEGVRAGIDARALGLLLPTDDGSAGTDNITLMNLHLTYALVATERTRLRIEGGISSAHAPDLTALGPSIALSFEAGLVGNLDLELRAQGTPYPYRQLDTQAGLALHLNALVLRGGWRGLYLNDMGWVDGVVHEDAFGGPFAGLGFAF